MKQWILSLLYFSKGDTRASLLLVMVCFLTLMGPPWLKNRLAPPPSNDPEWKKALLAGLQALEKSEALRDTLYPFYFDPNAISLDSLLVMNLPLSVAQTIIRYREKGGQFRRKEDLQKIYGLDSVLYATLEPYIQTPSKKSFPKRAVLPSTPQSRTSRSAKTIDINLASREEWQQFYGIGPVLSGRIIKFREALGGFDSIDQVGETYGLADSVFQQIRPFLLFKEQPKRIDINQCTLEVLAAHPYISWQLARRIVHYRQQHGPFNSLEDLSGMQALPADFFEKVIPYLKVE